MKFKRLCQCRSAQRKQSQGLAGCIQAAEEQQARARPSLHPIWSGSGGHGSGNNSNRHFVAAEVGIGWTIGGSQGVGLRSGESWPARQRQRPRRRVAPPLALALPAALAPPSAQPLAAALRVGGRPGWPPARGLQAQASAGLPRAALREVARSTRAPRHQQPAMGLPAGHTRAALPGLPTPILASQPRARAGLLLPRGLPVSISCVLMRCAAAASASLCASKSYRLRL